MRDAYIVGIGMNRFSKYPDETVGTMAERVIETVLADAGIGRRELQAGFFSNSFWGALDGQHSIRGQVVFRRMGIDKIPVTNVENACAGGSTALHMAYTSIRAGLYDVAIAVGSEKLYTPDKARAFAALASGTDVEKLPEFMAQIDEAGNSFDIEMPKDDPTKGQARSFAMDAYATGARRHIEKYGTTQRQLAAICSKNHKHGSLNPMAQYQKPMSIEEVLSDKPISYPLTRSMCAPIGDGAAAAIVCSRDYLKKLRSAAPVKILASVLGQGSDRNLDGESISGRLSRQAYEKAGLGPQDIDLAELHDATAFGELHQSEAMGFCAAGEGGAFAEAGETTIGGSIPINTSGGLECRGHPIGASGLAQIHELVLQLRGRAGKRQVDGVRIALAENGGGIIGWEEASMCVHILQKV